jgi:hypothetical protein
MPNRIIREGIITSDRVEQLDPASEVFYRRLLNKVDDHGLYDARPSILRANLYPLRIDRVREADISRWMAACQKAGLIVFYEAGGKPFLKVLNTNWQVRSEPKYPPPTDENICEQLLATEHLDVVVDGDGNTRIALDGFNEFWAAYPKKKNRGDAEKAWRVLKPNSAVVSMMLDAVEKAKTLPDWRKEGGQFIPYPGKWLRAKGWQDELFVDTPRLMSIV